MSHINLYQRRFPMFVASNPIYGGTNLNTTRNELTLQLDTAIHIAPNYRPSIRLHSANIWYTVPNVSQPLYNNDTLRISNDGVNNLDIVFPTGLYDVAGINDFISDFLVNNGLQNNLIVFSGVEATGNLQVQLNNATMRIIWANSTIAPLLGWTTASANTGPGIQGQTYVSPNAARFNRLESILIHCNIASGSYLGTRAGSDVIGKITPNVAPGELIIYTPFNLIETEMNTRNISSIRFRLTDQDNNTIDLSAEHWSFTIEILETPK